MKLSNLKTGNSAIIIKVSGHGGFRKRIIEMGFIKGKKVEVLLNAPLQDPVKYKIMEYEVSLRHSEAAQIEVLSEEEAKDFEQDAILHQQTIIAEKNDDMDKELSPIDLNAAIDKQHRIISVALIGNPNCGKTSLFNFASGAHERVGNYSGVTVDAKEGYAEQDGYRFNLVDLPGTYSLSAYSPEELYVRTQLTDKTPDIVINVIDTSNLERNLYLTTQLIDMHIPMVCALNMFDETEKRGDNINEQQLSELFGVPMVPTSFVSGRGIKELFKKVIDVYEDNEDATSGYRHIHINHGHEIEQGIKDIQEHLKQHPDVRLRYSTRYLAIKLLEHDTQVEDFIVKLNDSTEILEHRNEAEKRVKEETGNDSETAIMDAKYGFINGALKEANYQTGRKKDTYQTTHLLDSIFTHKYVGFPVFFLLLFLMFTATFTLGQYPMDWIDNGITILSTFADTHFPPGPLKDMLIGGIIGGVGQVIIFLPQILILYFFISYMEDSGYMARAAFIMDRLMHKIGLHGKSFIPLVMGFGCNVPAVMSTRTIESKRCRLITMLILPMMSCSARLPVYVMITGSFFAMKYRSLTMLSLYIIGILIAIIMSKIFSRFLVKGEDTPFVMELPPYRFPTWKAIGRHTWEKGKQYIKKMGGIILVASLIVWALGYFPINNDPTMSQQEQQEQSYIGRIGKAIEPIFLAQGFNWRLDVGLLAGVGAKEIVASTMGVLYIDTSLHQQITKDVAQKHNISIQEAEPIATLTAYCFLLFVLLYFPCIATVVAIKSETDSWLWASFSAIYTTALAWIVSAAVFRIGLLFI